MANPTVTFNLEQIEITVQCLKTETMRTIIQRFETKIQQSADSYVYLYNGGQVKLDLTFEQQANHLDRENNQMKILVYKTESNGFKCPYCAKKIKLGEDLNDIIKAYNNLKETINGIKSMLENIFSTFCSVVLLLLFNIFSNFSLFFLISSFIEFKVIFTIFN